MDDRHLLAPIKEPALRTRGYFVYNAETGGERPAVVARSVPLASGPRQPDRSRIPDL